jgi:hypothetical protein
MVLSHFVSYELFIHKELNTLSLVMHLPVKKEHLHTFFYPDFFMDSFHCKIASIYIWVGFFRELLEML